MDNIISISALGELHIKDCIEYYAHESVDERIDILQEEAAELIQALSKYKRRERGDYDKDARPMVIEEMAHTLCLISQVAHRLNITSVDLDKEFMRKNKIMKEGRTKP